MNYTADPHDVKGWIFQLRNSLSKSLHWDHSCDLRYWSALLISIKIRWDQEKMISFSLGGILDANVLSLLGSHAALVSSKGTSLMGSKKRIEHEIE